MEDFNKGCRKKKRLLRLSALQSSRLTPFQSIIGVIVFVNVIPRH
jgi:hypothetical protein